MSLVFEVFSIAVLSQIVSISGGRGWEGVGVGGGELKAG